MTESSLDRFKETSVFLVLTKYFLQILVEHRSVIAAFKSFKSVISQSVNSSRDVSVSMARTIAHEMTHAWSCPIPWQEGGSVTVDFPSSRVHAAKLNVSCADIASITPASLSHMNNKRAGNAWVRHPYSALNRVGVPVDHCCIIEIFIVHR